MAGSGARRGGVRAHERHGAVRETTGAAHPSAAIEPTESNLAAARVCGVWDAAAGGEFGARPNVAGGRADLGVAAVVHDGVGVAAGEFLEQLGAHFEKLVGRDGSE